MSSAQFTKGIPNLEDMLNVFQVKIITRIFIHFLSSIEDPYKPAYHQIKPMPDSYYPGFKKYLYNDITVSLFLQVKNC